MSGEKDKKDFKRYSDAPLGTVLPNTLLGYPITWRDPDETSVLIGPIDEIIFGDFSDLGMRLEVLDEPEEPEEEPEETFFSCVWRFIWGTLLILAVRLLGRKEDDNSV